MTPIDDAADEITPDILLQAYAHGIFPMSEDVDDPSLFWVEPEWRGIVPLDKFIVSSRLARTIRSDEFEIRVDTAFADVIDGCAAPQAGREETWISGRIRKLYIQLHDMGHAHSVETWQDGKLVGGLYGVSLGCAFFGESMFHRARDASKVALAHLVARLITGKYELLDTQYVTDHLKTFGAIEISRKQYQQKLDAALYDAADFHRLPVDTPVPGATILGIIANAQAANG